MSLYNTGMKDKIQYLYQSDINEQIGEEEYSRVETIVKTMEAVSKISNQSWFVIDYYRQQLIYRSKQLIFIDHAREEDFKCESINPYLSYVAEEDLNRMVESKQRCKDFFHKFSDEDKQNHVSVINFRIELHGKKIMIFQKYTPLLLRPNGKPWLGMFSIGHSIAKDYGKIYYFYGKSRFEYLEKSHTFKEERLSLSEMERKIMHGFYSGFSDKEICEKLCLSPNTIKTHKKNLYSKLCVRSREEAMMFVHNYNIEL
ncbi:MAG: response regulator transcription factor [Bacteroidaceae bacterium]